MRVIIDTNVLLLWLVGNLDPSRIEGHGALKKYQRSDYELLVKTASRHGRPHTLPNVLTEAINLLGASSDYARAAPLLLADWPETYIASVAAMEQPEYSYLGLTDTAILLAIGYADWLITADVKLHIAAVRRRLNTINFDHLRLN